MRGVTILFGLGLMALMPRDAAADSTVAGRWKADLGDNVTIEMTVTPDGKWSSETAQNDTTVAEMSGTYSQVVKSQTKGDLTFTPTEAKVTPEHGAVEVEHDTYEISVDRQVMILTAADDSMEFHKQTP